MKAEIRWDFIAVLAFSALWTAQAYAVVADRYLPDSDLPKSLCEIQFKDGGGQGSLTNTCSGTLVGSKYVLTASHCANLFTDSDIRAQVFCNGSAPLPNVNMPSFGRDVVGMVRDPSYVNINGFYLHDLAVFEIDGTYDDATPMPLVSSAEQEQALLAGGPSNCEFWGFGGDKNGITGRAEGAAFDLMSMPQVLAQLGSSALPPPPDLLFTGPNHAAPGDSGGPVICWDPSESSGGSSKGSWVQVGVASQMQLKAPVSSHVPLSEDIEWLQATLALPRLPALPQ